jgi:phosphate:Na+ symporter
MATIFELLGGIGLFLIGMALFTDGLTAFAGDSLRRALLRFTGTPAKAFTSGALITLIVQSSTATTITLIGFVSAGLLTFAQSLGVIMGASLGTTGTGWLIATLGLKVSLGSYTLPLIGIGALIRLLARNRWKAVGLCLAGFGMMFVGIDTLQDGMHGLTNIFPLHALNAESWWMKLATVLVGVLMTVLLQSSTAMVATTLTALELGAINFEQAALLVIGASIGTTMTGVLATIGGSILAKRTALAHVMFNLCSGLIALALLPALLWLIELLQARLSVHAGPIGLAAFHTLFIGLGVAIFLPHAAWFAKLIERLLPDKNPLPTRNLDVSQLQVPALALNSTHDALQKTAIELLEPLLDFFQTSEPGRSNAVLAPATQDRLRRALEATQDFFTRIPIQPGNDPLSELRLAQTHALDHILRLVSRCAIVLPAYGKAPVPAMLTDAWQEAARLLQRAQGGLSGKETGDWLDILDLQAKTLVELHQQSRASTMHETASGYRETTNALQILDTMRWLERIGHHVWRICHHLAYGHDLASNPNEAATTISSAPADFPR